ncbi:MAG: hypothetical protein JSS47_20475 [Proteobacteria bacterium]|nr:hypothetical protein [Pseudomonadota bacterium]
MSYLDDLNFERRIPYRHSLGTTESVTVKGAGGAEGGGFRFSITTPAPGGGHHVAEAFLDGRVLNELIHALLDLQEANERIAHQAGRKDPIRDPRPEEDE